MLITWLVVRDDRCFMLASTALFSENPRLQKYRRILAVSFCFCILHINITVHAGVLACPLCIYGQRVQSHMIIIPRNGPNRRSITLSRLPRRDSTLDSLRDSRACLHTKYGSKVFKKFLKTNVNVKLKTSTFSPPLVAS